VVRARTAASATDSPSTFSSSTASRCTEGRRSSARSSARGNGSPSTLVRPCVSSGISASGVSEARARWRVRRRSASITALRAIVRTHGSSARPAWKVWRAVWIAISTSCTTSSAFASSPMRARTSARTNGSRSASRRS
jgi:hypothetical protein